MDQPIIDWELGTKLAGNNRAVAEEMLDLLLKSLPDDLNQIEAAYTAKKYDLLTQLVHRLHGGLCYCGVPRLKSATKALELALKQPELSEVDTLYSQFLAEAKNLLSL